jgi:hypothetical protein
VSDTPSLAGSPILTTPSLPGSPLRHNFDHTDSGSLLDLLDILELAVG